MSLKQQSKFGARRCTLSVPGSNEKMLNKSSLINVDEILLDLEDSVALAQKDTARGLIGIYLENQKRLAPLTTVRVNSQMTDTGIKDVEFLLDNFGNSFNSLVVPKVESPEEVEELDSRLLKLESKNSLERSSVKLQLQIESAKGLVLANKIAASSDRILSLIFGPGDFAASIGMPVLNIGENPENFPGEDIYHYPLMKILIAAKSNGLNAIDGPVGDIHNPSALKRRTNLSASMGYDGKWAIHPSQIDIINAGFTPTVEKFRAAKKLIEFLENENKLGKGALLYEGNMIDEASKKMAQTVVARGTAAGLN